LPLKICEIPTFLIYRGWKQWVKLELSYGFSKLGTIEVKK
jgi:hypothetical protein